MMPQITYDPESEILNIKLSKSPIVDTDILENCVLDYDVKGQVVNIEVLKINLEKLITKNA